jgi:hypothetical protein
VIQQEKIWATADHKFYNFIMQFILPNYKKLAVHPNPVKVMLKGKENRVHEHKAKT